MDSTGLRQRVGKGERTPTTYVMPVPKSLQSPAPIPMPIIENAPRGLFDRMVDYLVGDGPGYATPVHCSRCNAFYANIPKTEVPTLQYVCGGCGHFNSNEKVSTPVQNVTTTTSSPTTANSPDKKEQGNALPDEDKKDKEEQEVKEEGEGKETIDSEENKEPTNNDDDDGDNNDIHDDLQHNQPTQGMSQSLSLQNGEIEIDGTLLQQHNTAGSPVSNNHPQSDPHHADEGTLMD